MRNRIRLLLAIAAALVVTAPAGAQQPRQAEEQLRQRTEEQVQQRQRIYGEALMTELERNRYRERLQGLQYAQERARFEKAHQKQMQDRARQQGKVLDEDGDVLSGDRLRDRDQDRDREGDRDQDRDRARQMDQTSRPANAPPPRKGSGRGGG